MSKPVLELSIEEQRRWGLAIAIVAAVWMAAFAVILSLLTPLHYLLITFLVIITTVIGIYGGLFRWPATKIYNRLPPRE